VCAIMEGTLATMRHATVAALAILYWHIRACNTVLQVLAQIAHSLVWTWDTPRAQPLAIAPPRPALVSSGVWVPARLNSSQRGLQRGRTSGAGARGCMPHTTNASLTPSCNAQELVALESAKTSLEGDLLAAQAALAQQKERLEEDHKRQASQLAAEAHARQQKAVEHEREALSETHRKALEEVQGGLRESLGAEMRRHREALEEAVEGQRWVRAAKLREAKERHAARVKALKANMAADIEALMRTQRERGEAAARCAAAVQKLLQEKLDACQAAFEKLVEVHRADRAELRKQLEALEGEGALRVTAQQDAGRRHAEVRRLRGALS
jgi:hypothetical protein